MLNYHDIGKQVKIERIKQDMTQEQLSELVGISPSYMSAIECGLTKLGLTTFYKIANALTVSTDVLLCYSVDNKESRAVLMNHIADLTSDCSKSELVVIEEVVSATKNALRKIQKEDA